MRKLFIFCSAILLGLTRLVYSSQPLHKDIKTYNPTANEAGIAAQELLTIGKPHPPESHVESEAKRALIAGATQRHVHFYDNSEGIWIILERQRAHSFTSETERIFKLRAATRVSRPAPYPVEKLKKSAHKSSSKNSASGLPALELKIKLPQDKHKKLASFQALSTKQPGPFKRQFLQEDLKTFSPEKLAGFLSPSHLGPETEAILYYALTTPHDQTSEAWHLFKERAQGNNLAPTELFKDMLELDLFEQATEKYLEAHNDVFPFYHESTAPIVAHS